jgi:hypothetical protein
MLAQRGARALAEPRGSDAAAAEAA